MTFIKKSQIIEVREGAKTLKKNKAFLKSLGDCCSNCGSTTNLEIHHKNPINNGGLNNIENLVRLCRTCHNSIDHKELMTNEVVDDISPAIEEYFNNLAYGEEVWKPCREFPNYLISNYGKVKHKKVNKVHKWVIRERRPYVKIEGTQRTIHRLVAEAFLEAPKCDSKIEVNHINAKDKIAGCLLIPHASNLSWVSPEENKLHAYREGLLLYQKVRNVEICMIRTLRKKGLTHKTIAELMEVSESTVRHLLQGRTHFNAEISPQDEAEALRRIKENEDILKAIEEVEEARRGFYLNNNNKEGLSGLQVLAIRLSVNILSSNSIARRLNKSTANISYIRNNRTYKDVTLEEALSLGFTIQDIRKAIEDIEAIEDPLVA